MRPWAMKSGKSLVEAFNKDLAAQSGSPRFDAVRQIPRAVNLIVNLISVHQGLISRKRPTLIVFSAVSGSEDRC